jgi:hypothetical protein
MLYRRAVLANIDSFLAENPNMGIPDLGDICGTATIILFYNPNITTEDLSDELDVSYYSAERVRTLVKLTLTHLEKEPW